MWSGVRDFFDFSRGSIDVLVVPQEDGSLASTPFHIRFGRGQLLREEEKTVYISVNGEPVDLVMRLGEAGEAYFVTSPADQKKSKKENVVTEEDEDRAEKLLNEPLLSSATAAPAESDNALQQASVPSANETTHEHPPAPAIDGPTDQAATRWTWGWGVLPRRKQVSSLVASPNSSFNDLPKLTSFTEGESHITADSSKSSPPLLRARRNSLQEPPVSSDVSGYGSDGDKAGQDVGSRRKWGMGALINMFKQPQESVEPVYLIKPTDSDLLSAFPDDDEDAEGMDEYFYSAVSPRECASPTGIPRNHSLERLNFLEEAARQLGDEDVLELQANAIERELEREESGDHDLVDECDLVEGEDQEPTAEEELQLSTKYDKDGRHDSSENGSSESKPRQNEEEKHEGTIETAQTEESASLDKHQENRPADDSQNNEERRSAVEEANNDAKSNGSDTSKEFTSEATASTSGPAKVASIEEEDHWSTQQYTRKDPNGSEYQDEDKIIRRVQSEGDGVAHAAETDQPLERRMELPQRSRSESHDNEMTVTLSLCGDILPDTAAESAERVFEEHRLSSAEFWKDPSAVLADPRLVVRFRNTVYSGKDGVAMLVSHLAFGETATREASKALTPIPKGQHKGQGGREQSTPMRSTTWRWWWSSTSTPTRNAKAEERQSAPEARTLRPTSEQLSMLKLKEGANKAVFTVRSDIAIQEVTAMIYLWPRLTKIVISDIDGTITKSDLLGHILPIVGRDWSHSGIAQLYSNIQENGYRILYLSSRSIGQANLTRGYISALRQEDVSLPEGPVFTSPNGLLRSVHREVIRRNPEEFKIACLKDILALFPPQSNPYYAGFGNRPSDAISYLTVGVPKGKIFTINQRGEITLHNRTYKRSYMKLNEVVHEMFPAINQPPPREEYNQFQYWRLPEVDATELEPL